MLTFLLVLSVAMCAYAVGRVHEGARKGGTVDLLTELARRDIEAQR